MTDNGAEIFLPRRICGHAGYTSDRGACEPLDAVEEVQRLQPDLLVHGLAIAPAGVGVFSASRAELPPEPAGGVPTFPVRFTGRVARV